MSEKRFYITDTGLGLDTESDEMYSFGDEEDFCRLFDKLNEQQATINKLKEENEMLKSENKKLQCINMSEKRFVIDEEGISDNKTDKWYCWKEEVVGLLNEQQEMIEQLEKENTALLDLAESLGVKIVEADDE